MKTPEMIYVINKAMELVGATERKFAEAAGLWHLTALLLAVRLEDMKFAIQIRSQKKRTFPNHLDIYGGHCSVGGEWASTLAGSIVTIESIVTATAIREANEELRMADADGCPVVIDEHNAPLRLRQFGEIGEFELDSASNRERSTLFGLVIPQGATLHPTDEQDGVHEPVRNEFHSLDELAAIHRTGQRPIADGLGRILKRASENDGFKNSIKQFVARIAADSRAEPNREL